MAQVTIQGGDTAVTQPITMYIGEPLYLNFDGPVLGEELILVFAQTSSDRQMLRRTSKDGKFYIPSEDFTFGERTNLQYFIWHRETREEDERPEYYVRALGQLIRNPAIDPRTDAFLDNTAPTAVDQSVAFLVDGDTVNGDGNLLAGSGDEDGNTLSVRRINGATIETWPAQVGEVLVDEDGTLRPVEGAADSETRFDFRLWDGYAETAQRRAIVTVQEGVTAVAPTFSTQPSLSKTELQAGQSVAVNLGAANGTPEPSIGIIAATLNGENVLQDLDGASYTAPEEVSGDAILTVIVLASNGVQPPAQATLSALVTPAPDITAPVLSAPTASVIDHAAIEASVTTDTAEGTLTWVVTQGATPTAAQIRAGQDASGATAADSGSQAVSATGAQTITASELAAETGYTVHFTQRDVAGNDSTPLSTDEITTDAAPVEDSLELQPETVRFDVPAFVLSDQTLRFEVPV